MVDTNNPLQKYFRQPSLYLKLPTLGRWYDQSSIELTADSEIAVYGLTALDEIMINTPDAMLNGKALEAVITHAAPSIRDVKKLLIPDLEALFVAIKIATNQGKFDLDRTCVACKHENTFEVNCQHLLDSISYVDGSDSVVNFDDNLIIHVKPYSFEMRQLFLQREYQEEAALRVMSSSDQNITEFDRARILGESVERLSRITFDLVSKSIEKIVMVNENIVVTDPAHISEWLVSINKGQADAVIKAVDSLNKIGVQKSIKAQCTSCGHTWDEELGFDPMSFFGRR
jgi:hypothetical protein